MGEEAVYINKNNTITVSRNTPISLVVGAAGFIGSNLTERLLQKNIQIIGLDNLLTGKRANLENSVKDKNFHFIEVSAEDISLELPRLDYIFIVASDGWKIEKLLNLAKLQRSKIVFVSSIELYDLQDEDDLEWFKHTESRLAKFAQENNLNARILRIAPVYGPRMNFKNKDPMTRLIQGALLEVLQKEPTPLEFSSRALFIDDATSLIVRSMFSGATALKIFDGCLIHPIKVTEIKQILLDPIWHENRGIEPSELPPWPTPNLEKTIKYLSWAPQAKLVKSLKETVSYFRDNEIKITQIPKTELEKPILSHPNPELVEFFKPEVEKEVKAKVKKDSKGIKETKLFRGILKIPTILALILIFYVFLWPFISLGWGILSFNQNLNKASENLEKGQFKKSLDNIKQAKHGIDQTKVLLSSAGLLKDQSILKDFYRIGDKLIDLANISLNSAEDTVKGVESLYQGLKAVTGEINDSPKDYFAKASLDLAEADEGFSQALAALKDNQFRDELPDFLADRMDSFKLRLEVYLSLVQKARAVSLMLPQMVALDGSKSYLVLLQNNNELRPTGGFIGSFAQIDFGGGKLKKLEVNDIYNIDGQLPLHVEPPKEIKEDLGQKDWFLRDSNWEPDFPTSAKQAEWFYTKETALRVDGVVALDISAIENLLGVVGYLDLAEYGDKVTAENLFEKAVSRAEVGFFPGSQAKKSYLTALSSQLFNKLFFLPNQNWPKIVEALGRSLEEKHMSVYLSDPKLFSYLLAQNWAGVLPRAPEDKIGEYSDFLAPVEANLGANKANYYLDRRYFLETAIGKEGEIGHRLRINFLNRSPSEVWPAGKYKNRIRIYLPFGTKLIRALWGEANITNQVTAFADYGRSGYSIFLTLDPKEDKNLILDYQLGPKLQFSNNKAIYRLDVVKQAGTLRDPFEWKLTYPINYKIVSQQNQNIEPQEYSISTDLSTDRRFEVRFSK